MRNGNLPKATTGTGKTIKKISKRPCLLDASTQSSYIDDMIKRHFLKYMEDADFLSRPMIIYQAVYTHKSDHKSNNGRKDRR